LITAKGGMVVPVTGRTVGDIESDFVKRKIKLPEIIIGDNGANIYSTVDKSFIVKKKLEHEKVMTIIAEFLKNGGDKNNIRYTNGANIFASDEKNVKKYYKKSKTVKFCEDICKTIQQTDDITKITLAGSKEQILQIAEFVKNLEFWTDMDVTKFPNKECENYRLDISQKNINKGEAIKEIIKQIKPRYGYMCVGNGYNDMAMFKVAIDDGMIVSIMGNSSIGLKEDIQKYSKDKKRGKVMVVPNNKDLANKYILKMSKIFESYINREERKRQKKEGRLPDLPRVKVKGIDSKAINSNTIPQCRNKNR
jgi:hydroxymethylpyrimidine pyrophosphatase-like HAD family hydrolase